GAIAMIQHLFRKFNRALSVVALLSLAACGGGGAGSSLTGTTTPPPTTPTTPTTDYSVQLLASKTSIGTNDSVGSNIIALVKDANNNLVTSAPVTITATSGNLQGAPFITDSTGSAKGVLTTANLFANSQITLTANAGGANSAPLVITASGTSIGILGANSATIGVNQSYSLTLTDANGTPIPNQTINLATTNGSINPSQVTTSNVGSATFTFTPGTTDAVITASATTLNTTATQSVSVSQNSTAITTPNEGQILTINTIYPVTANITSGGSPMNGVQVSFTSTRGVLSAPSATTNSNGDATVNVTSPTSGPAVLSASANGVTGVRNISFTAPAAQRVIVQSNTSVLAPNSSTQIQALVQDNSGNAVVGTTVDFTIEYETSGGTLSATSAITNTQGVATVTYTAGAGTDNSFDIKATDRATQIFGRVSLSVAGQSFSVILGTDNQIVKNSTNATYEKTYNIIVTDNTGAPVQGAIIKLRALPQFYRKGVWKSDVANNWTQTISTTCGNEDLNFNGVLDSGEDINSDGKLEPGNVVTFSQPLATDANGTSTFKIIYGETYAQWVNIDLSATATVTGTEGTNTLSFWLPIASGDITGNISGPAGNPSPFGVATNCSDPH
ncbi:MAG: hypothetical protein B7Y07_12195, partial [Halothiobacillus sp. 24-54-40]